MKRFLKSLKLAWRGLTATAQHEPNFRIELAVACLVLIGGYLLNIERWEWMLVIICIGLVLASELFNSALERLADVVTEREDDRIGLLKDMGAGAVLVTASASALVGLLIVLPRLGLLPI